MLTTLLALVAIPALAQPLEVVAGEDLGAWREIQQLRPEGEEAVAAYQWFLLNYPTSSLAEVAWVRLGEMGAVEQTRAEYPELESTIQDLEKSSSLHQVALSRAPARVIVADLEPDGTPLHVDSPRWRPALVGGTGYAGSPYGAVGLRLDRGPVGFVGRFGHRSELYGEFALRLSAPTSTLGFKQRSQPGGLFVETGIDTLGGVGAVGGGRLVLSQALMIEAMGGARFDGLQIRPDVRLEVVHPL